MDIQFIVMLGIAFLLGAGALWVVYSIARAAIADELDARGLVGKVKPK